MQRTVHEKSAQIKVNDSNWTTVWGLMKLKFAYLSGWQAAMIDFFNSFKQKSLAHSYDETVEIVRDEANYEGEKHFSSYKYQADTDIPFSVPLQYRSVVLEITQRA